jgi:PAS domain S-box-containing protein
MPDSVIHGLLESACAQVEQLQQGWPAASAQPEQTARLSQLAQTLQALAQGFAADEATRQAKTQEFDRFFDLALDLFCIANTEGYFLQVNPTWEKMLGYSQAELLTHSFLDFVHPDDRDHTLAVMHDLAAQKQIWHFENRYRCQDGTYRWLEWNSIPVGQIVYAAARDVTERKQAEAALRFSQEKFYKAFHTSPDSININRLSDGVYIDINDGFTAMTGYTREEVLGRSSLPGDLNIWANADDRNQLVAGIRAKGEVVGLEATFRFKDGSLHTGLMSAKVIDVEGEPCLLSISRDITERKQMEEALRESETRYRLVAENVRDVIWTTDNDYRFTYISPSIQYLRGIDPQAAMSENIEDTMPPESYQRVRQAVVDRLAAEAQGQSSPLTRLEVQQKRGDGSLVWVEILTQPLFDEAGQRVGFVGISRDISERKQAEGLIQAQRDQLEAQNEELLAQNEELVAQAEGLAQAEAELRQFNAALEQRVAARTAELSARTQELSLANAALVRAARLKDEFLAAMSHELRTPLTGILGLSEALYMGIYGPLPEKQLKLVNTIYESGQHLLDLINDILDVSKIEAGMTELHLAPVSVVEVSQASLQFVRQLAQKKNLKLTTSQDFSINVVQADGRRLKQMLVNLLSNAVKFTPQGGAVGLNITSDPSRGEVRFTVSDTGIGIAREDLPRLFKPFVQLDSRLSREYSGTGLGLSLVMGLAEAHGGRVEVESELGIGSRFTLILPWSPDTDEAPVKPGQSAAPLTSLDSAERQALPAEDSPISSESLTGHVEGPTVLLVDDSELVLSTVGNYLRGQSYQVTLAHHGAEALEKAHELYPAVILMDIQMPGLDGLEAMRRLRAAPEPRLATTPIIALTALAMPGDRERCLAAGATEYMTKPVNLATLTRVIEACLASHPIDPA